MFYRTMLRTLLGVLSGLNASLLLLRGDSCEIRESQKSQSEKCVT
jgi:hypothetical protein